MSIVFVDTSTITVTEKAFGIDTITDYHFPTAPAVGAARRDRRCGVPPRPHRHAPRQTLPLHTLPKDLQAQVSIGYKLGPRLRELAPRGQREPGGGIHPT